MGRVGEQVEDAAESAKRMGVDSGTWAGAGQQGRPCTPNGTPRNMWRRGSFVL